MVHTCVVIAGTALLMDAALLIGISLYRAARRRRSRTPTTPAPKKRSSRWHHALTRMYGISAE
jgi:hypothetical protein